MNARAQRQAVAAAKKVLAMKATQSRSFPNFVNIGDIATIDKRLWRDIRAMARLCKGGR